MATNKVWPGSKDPESCEKSTPCLVSLPLAKGRRKGVKKAQNPPSVSFPFYWLKGAERGRRNRIGQKQSLARIQRSRIVGKSTPCLVSLLLVKGRRKGTQKGEERTPCFASLLLVKRRKKGVKKGAKSTSVSFPFYWLNDAERGLKKAQNPPLSRFPFIG